MYRLRCAGALLKGVACACVVVLCGGHTFKLWVIDATLFLMRLWPVSCAKGVADAPGTLFSFPVYPPIACLLESGGMRVILLICEVFILWWIGF